MAVDQERDDAGKDRMSGRSGGSVHELLAMAIPAQPGAVAAIDACVRDGEGGMDRLANLVERDMGLCAAVLKTVNSALFGLGGRISTVRQALTYLGTREVAAAALQASLSAAFPAVLALQPIWQRATVRGILMGRLAARLDVNPWAAHSAGVFEECGKAVLFRHAPGVYLEILGQARDEAHLLELEGQQFQVGHDLLGAALSETWGLAPAAVEAIRYRMVLRETGGPPRGARHLSVCGMAALANRLLEHPDDYWPHVEALAGVWDWDPDRVLAVAAGLRPLFAAPQA